ncbi:MAG: dihydroorotate dehydrogenase [Candidatus Thermoplasmatota archaeon]|nr:dihydroorotate dehydrogenase [Candidatus Thermoplasmatota archaeon]
MLSTEISGLKLRNPTILASGILGETGESLINAARNGAGAVTTKSIGIKPNEGNKNPTVLETGYGLINAVGLANPGIDNYENEIKTALKSNVSVIGSVFGKNKKEFVLVSKKMENFGVNAVELNLSCPHARGYGVEIGEDKKLVYDIVKNVKKTVDIPVFVKISGHSNILSLAKNIESAKADAIVAINSLRGIKIDLDLRIPVLSNKIGGYSGPGIKPVGVRTVYEIASSVKIPVIGCGGVMNGKDAVEYMMAGASAVQIGSAVHYRGVDVFRKICKEIRMWMKKNDYKKIDEIVGVALQ